MVLEFMQRGQLAAGDPNAFPVLFISSVMQVLAVPIASYLLLYVLLCTTSITFAYASAGNNLALISRAWLPVRSAVTRA